MYQSEIIKEEPILEWLESARKKIEQSKNAPATEESKQDEPAANDVDSYYGEEEGGGEQGVTPIDIPTMEMFVAGMKQFEEYL